MGFNPGIYPSVVSKLVTTRELKVNHSDHATDAGNVNDDPSDDFLVGLSQFEPVSKPVAQVQMPLNWGYPLKSG